MGGGGGGGVGGKEPCSQLCILKICFLLLLLLSRFSRVRLYVTPQMSAHQALLPLGFSRQEHWSGLPFPSPMPESEKVKVKLLSRVWLLVTPWTAAYQAPPSMGFSRQEYWRGVPLPSPQTWLLINNNEPIAEISTGSKLALKEKSASHHSKFSSFTDCFNREIKT